MEKKKAPPPVADINVTPMVDVMLVLLIIFMVITPMLTKGVSVDLVKTKNPITMQAADKEDAILISVTRNGGVFLSPGNLKLSGPDQLPERVRDLLTNKIDKTVYISSRRPRPVFGGGGRGRQLARGRSERDRSHHRRAAREQEARNNTAAAHSKSWRVVRAKI